MDADRPATETEPHGDKQDKEYVGYIWIGDGPGERISVWARSAEEAGQKVEAEFGEGHPYSIRNEDDANRAR